MDAQTGSMAERSHHLESSTFSIVISIRSHPNKVFQFKGAKLFSSQRE